MKNTLSSRFALLWCAAGLLFAAAPAFAAADAPGAKDHPEIKRITGSQIFYCKASAYGELNIPEEKVIMRSSDQGGLKEPKHEHLEGKLTTIYYALPPDVSTLEAVRQYEGELKQRDFQTLWRADRNDDLENLGGYFTQYVFPEVADNRSLKYFHSLNTNEQRYLAMKGKSAKGNDLYVTAYAFVLNEVTGDVVGGFEKVAKFTKGQTVLRVDVLESKSLDARLTVVKAEEITDTVAKTGRIAIYGIYFDTDKADLKPESQPSLNEMARAIKGAGKGKRFLIVGHTDNQGAFDYNQALSAKRARAVVEALTRTLGVDAGAVIPVGVGMAAPVGPNTDEEGRSKNRRVEIVAM